MSHLISNSSTLTYMIIKTFSFSYDLFTIFTENVNLLVYKFNNSSTAVKIKIGCIFTTVF